jgi:Leucine-rich repeat (LRR) protein
LSFKNGIHEKIEFADTDQQKRDTKSVSFQHCSTVDFVDIEILKRFPNLFGLSFWGSNIPILKNIFTIELKMIQYLDLSHNNIKILEAHVFDELVDLKLIDLAYNEIEEILYPIFAKNKKLEFVNLSRNKIRLLHPNLFDGLPRLKQVQFLSNPTVSKCFDQSNIKTLNVELKPLFDNFSLKNGNPNRVKELELVSFFYSYFIIGNTVIKSKWSSNKPQKVIKRFSGGKMKSYFSGFR